MSPAKIHFGIAIRLIGMVLLTVFVINTILVTDDVFWTAVAIISAAVVIPILAWIVILMLARPLKARFGLAMIGINLAMTLFALVTLGLMPALPLSMDILLGGLTIWHGFMTWIRKRQFQDGSYVKAFEPKPGTLAPLAALRKRS